MDEDFAGHRRGDRGFRRAALAMFAAGAATFMALHALQPLLPVLARELGVGPAGSSLLLAASTATLAIALLPAGWLSDAWGRTRVMGLALLALGLLGVLAAAAPGFASLLALRALQGIALAGVPGVAMAYLAEEIHESSLGTAIGLYISGNAIGGMAGRLLGGVMTEHGSWRIAVLGVSLISLAGALAFLRLVPASRRQRRRRVNARAAARSLRIHLRDRGQLRLDVLGALLMGTFVAVFNGLGFRLEAAPYHLGETAIAAVFLVYAVGSLASATAGRLADRFGAHRVLPAGILVALAGIGVTTLRPLALVVAGMSLLAIGFFAAHSVASSAVGRGARTAPAQAAALYLLAYYVGASVAGPLGGLAWSAGRWAGVAGLAATLLVTALLVSLKLGAAPRPAPRPAPAGAGLAPARP
jgi:YNFM family putative membrane transporter